MEFVVSPEEMKRIEQNAMTDFGMESLVLMERAALSAVDVLFKEEFDLNKILIICGPGNNGADGLAITRILAERGYSPEVVAVTNGHKVTKEFELQRNILEHMQIVPTSEVNGAHYTVIIDAMFGISLNRDLGGEYLDLIHFINGEREHGAKVLAIDMPTGIHAGNGRIMGDAVKADVTVTFTYLKTGQLLYPGTENCNKLICKKIGITDFMCKEKPAVSILSDLEIRMPKRNPAGNKGTFGKILFVTGSKEICGASILSALAAFRSGCGMVKIMTAVENRESISTVLPEAMLSLYSEWNKETLNQLEKDMEWCDCIAIGPGLGKSDTAYKITIEVLKNSPVPVILDADALNILSEQTELLSDCSQEVIITPHVGEMSRLTGISTKDISNHLIETAVDFARSFGVTCVLKDARTIIADESSNVIINTTGNDGMATAGSGDVLTGIMAALVAAKIASNEECKGIQIAALACALHGRAGDYCLSKLTREEVMARDIIKYLEETDK